MRFSETLTYVVGLLFLERRVSIRRLRKDLALDDATLEDLRHELTVTKRIAIEEDGEVLVWAPASVTVAGMGAAPTAMDSSEQSPDVSRNLQEERATGAERRQLTVAFIDLVGSTALSTELDPEDLRDVITAFQDVCRQAVQRYDGFVARYMGDGMLVYFGYPGAHEDDAERAVRAGLDVLAAMPALNTAVRVLCAADLSVRIGVATGPVVVGDLIGEGAAEEAAVVGETPNLAARLQTVAAPDQLVVSGATRELAGDGFAYDDLGLHVLKGIAAPTQAWAVIAAVEIEQSSVALPPEATRTLVGRDEELGLLRRAWENSRQGDGQCVQIVGEPGVGKSRLLEALREDARENPYMWVSLRCSPYHRSTPLYPVIEHLKRAVGWAHGDDDVRRLRKLEDALKTQSAPLPEVVPLFADLMSLPIDGSGYALPADLTPQQHRDATLDAVAGWLLELTETQPLMQVCEDLHWADPTTLELLGLYMDQAPTAKILIVMTYRPDFTPPWPQRSHVTPITLNRLDRAQVALLVRDIAGGRSLPGEVLEHILTKADGVPLYVEELTKAVLDSDLLREVEDHFELNDTLANMQIPATLQDSLMARLDRVPALKELAQMGAVLGREFAYEMLAALSDFQEPNLSSGLNELVSNELLFQRGRPPRARYIFKHALIQDAAYQSLLKRSRQGFHRKVARMLVTQFETTATIEPALVAHHFAAGGEYDEAASHWTSAGHQAMQRWATAEATDHLRNALRMLQSLPEGAERDHRELGLQTALGPALLASKGFGDAVLGEAYQRAAELCERVGTVEQACLTLRGLQVYHFARGELARSTDIGGRLLERATVAQHTPFCIGANHALGQSLFLRGQLAPASDVLEAGISLTNGTPELVKDWAGGQPAEQCHLYAGFVRWFQGRNDLAIAHAREGLAWSESLGNPISLANTEAFVALMYLLCRDAELAGKHAHRAVVLATEHAHPTFLPFAQVLLGASLAERGELAEGVALMERGLDDYSKQPIVLWIPALRAPLAAAYLQLGRIDAARQLVAGPRESEEHVWDSSIKRLEGELLGLDDDTFEHAVVALGEAMTIAKAQGALGPELQAAIALAALWLRKGHKQRARETLQPVYACFDRAADTPDLRDARTLLARADD